MSEQMTAVAESSPRTEFNGWDAKGTPIVVEPPKKQESAPVDPPKEAKESSEATAKTAAESDTAPKQEKAHKGTPAPERKAQLSAEIQDLIKQREQIKAEIEAARKTDVKKVESSPAKAEEKKGPQNYSEWLDSFDEQKFVKDWMEKNPGKSYERAVMAMTDLQHDVRSQYERYEQRVQSERAEITRKAEEIKKIYPDFEDKSRDVVKQILAQDVPPFVKAFINESDVMEHLVYALSGGPLESIIELSKTQPGKALRALRDLERDTADALNKPKAEKTEKEPEKPAEKTPVETKPRAKIPHEVSGRGVTADPEAEAIRNNDFKTLDAEWTRKALASRR